FFQLTAEGAVKRLQAGSRRDDQQAAAVEIFGQVLGLGLRQPEVVMAGHEQQRIISCRRVVQVDVPWGEIDIDTGVGLESLQQRVLQGGVDVPASLVADGGEAEDVPAARGAAVDREFLGKEAA